MGYIVEQTLDHTGKMEGMHSISTSVRLNSFCLKNQSIKNSICQKCYANSMLKQYSALEEKLKRNTEVLTTSVIPKEFWPDTTGQKFFRLESFGDLNNEIQLINYMNIVNKNPETMFTLFTKNYKLVYEYFAKYDVPDNFTLVISSLLINQRINLDFMKKLNKFKKGQLKVFTVFDYEYIKEHLNEIDINCGNKMCIKCTTCYAKNYIEEVNEILKSDTSRVNELLKINNSEYIQDLVDLFDEL